MRRTVNQRGGEEEVTTQTHRLAQSACHFTALHSQIRAAERKHSVTIYESGDVITVTYALRAEELLLYISVSENNNLREQEQPQGLLVAMTRTEEEQALLD